MGIRRSSLLGFGLLLVAAIAAAVCAASVKTVQIDIDGQTQSLRTRAGTVGEALRDAGLRLTPEDSVLPPAEARLELGTPIRVRRAHWVGVAANGQVRAVRAQAMAPLDLLSGLGLTLGPGDELWTNGTRAAEAARGRVWSLRLQRAVEFSLAVDGAEPQPVRAAGRSVGEALWDLGYRLYAGDSVAPALETSLTPALSVEIQHARPVWVQADGQTLVTRTRSRTVGAMLDEVGLALVGEDYTLPAEDQPVPASGVIDVVRVREEVITEQQLIRYDTLYQAMPEAEIDQVYPLQAGQPGVRRRLTRVRYENGAEVSRAAEAEVLVQEPVPQVIGYGTKIVIRTLDTPDGPIEYWRAYNMYATSYAAKFFGLSPDSKSYGRTASGKLLTKGLVAIDRSLIPFGTRMYVPGYGLAEAADTGGGVRGRWIDLGFDDWNYVGWHSTVMVYFLTPVPPADAIHWLIPQTVP